MNHPPPNEIAIAHCPACARLSLATHVSRLDQIPPRYCRVCGGVLGVELYRHVQTVAAGGPR